MVMKPDKLLDIAFKKARTTKGSTAKERAIAKIMTIKQVLISRLEKESEFGDIESLSLFHRKLLDAKIGIVNLKKALSMIYKSKNIISKLAIKYQYSIQRSHKKQVQVLLKAFYGRASSIVKSLKNPLELVFIAKQCLNNAPKLKKMFTACIIGFPNVGKTTLFMNITGSKPEIANYSFTTININLGYIKLKDVSTVQVLDAPGTLNRVNKMNPAELQAWIAAEIADIIIFVFDIGMDIEKQLKLRERFKIFKRKIINYISKADIIRDKDIKEFANKAALKDYYTKSESIKKLLIRLSLKNSLKNGLRKNKL